MEKILKNIMKSTGIEKIDNLFVFCFFLFINVIYAQEVKLSKNDIKFINNKIEYSIVRISCVGNDGMSHTIIGEKVIINLSNEQLDVLNKLTCEQWMTLLMDKKTDWGSNVILYYLSGRPVMPYFNRKEKRPKEWVNVFKKQDIKMWSEIICNPFRQLLTIPNCEQYLKLEQEFIEM